jgi:hypothetical protein
MNEKPPRHYVNRALYNSNSDWDVHWRRAGSLSDRDRMLDLVAGCLGGKPPLWADARTTEASEPLFEMVAVGSDRIVYVTGAPGTRTPAAAVIPRHELSGLVVRELPYEPSDFGEFTTREAAVTLEYNDLELNLPWSSSRQGGAAGVTLVELIPGLLMDRLSTGRQTEST